MSAAEPRSPLLFAARVLLAFACIEGPSCAATRFFEQRGYSYAPEDASEFRVYSAQRDLDLGWIDQGWHDIENIDGSGARRLPAFPDPLTPTCIALYGDSFTWGAEVDDEHTWANVLAKRAGCRVASWGVRGYGTDQAFLRFRGNRFEKPRIVLLGIFSEDITRNVNRYRALIQPRFRYGFKPRFELDERGELRLVPMPAPANEAEFSAIAERPEDHLAHEFFVPDGPTGPTRRAFPYSLTMLRLFRSFRFCAAMAGESPWAPFYDEHHPSGALAVTAAIARELRREAARRGAFGAVVVIPDAADLRTRRRRGRWVYQPLLDALARDGVPALDAGERLDAAAGRRDPCALYTRCQGGHFTNEGYAELGELVYAWLHAMGQL